MFNWLCYNYKDGVYRALYFIPTIFTERINFKRKKLLIPNEKRENLTVFP